jgi:hypothetical protein
VNLPVFLLIDHLNNLNHTNSETLHHKIRFIVIAFYDWGELYMKSYKNIIIGIVVVVLTVGAAMTLEAEVTQPGSVDDPVVTKSYVDQAILQAVTAIGTGGAGGGSGAAAKLEVVVMQPGQTLMAGAGTEFIVRTGRVLAVSNDQNGIPNVTAGKDIAAGLPIELNHLLVFPNDKRGIKGDPKSKDVIYVMVRGSYTLLNP